MNICLKEICCTQYNAFLRISVSLLSYNAESHQ